MKRLAIIGAGDLGQQIAYHAYSDRQYDVAGFFDDFRRFGETVGGYPVMGKIDNVQEQYKSGNFDALMIGVGYKHFSLRIELFKRFSLMIPFASVIHSSAYIDSSCKIGNGVFIYPGCTLDMNAVIGNNVLVNAGCVIAHDSELGDHSFLSPAVSVAGFVRIDQAVSLGIGTIVIDNIRISSGIRTGAGAVVTEDLSVPGLYVGVPAKIKKRYDSI